MNASCSGMIIRMTNFVILVELHDIFKLLKLIVSLSLKKQHRVSAKTLRHFPLIPRPKRLFMCSKTADYLRWHEEKCSKDGKLRHPADGLTWKDFDRLHPDFAQDCRNVRLRLLSDGYNPFRTMSISHSTRSVILMGRDHPEIILIFTYNH